MATPHGNSRDLYHLLPGAALPTAASVPSASSAASTEQAAAAGGGGRLHRPHGSVARGRTSRWVVVCRRLRPGRASCTRTVNVPACSGSFKLAE
jgi:hypothetical protein